MIDNKFLRAYKRWLKEHTDLTDCAYRPDDPASAGFWRWTDAELEELRNHPRDAYILREAPSGQTFKLFRGEYTPSLNDLARHVINQERHTIWTANSSRFDTLLMLADIDNKEGTGDAEGAAKHLAATYLSGEAFVEHSVGGNGRHAYFRLDTRVTGVTFFRGREDIGKVVKDFAALVSQDGIFRECGVVFDGFYGLPTCWTKADEVWRISKRGSNLKLPYCSDGLADLARLAQSRPLRLEDVMTSTAALRRDRRLVAAGKREENKGYMSVTSPSPSLRRVRPSTDVDPAAIADAFEKKRLCIDQTLRGTDGECTTAEVLDEYHRNWHPTGMTPGDVARRRRLLDKMLEERRRTFRPAVRAYKHAFRRGEFLRIVEQLVAPSAFAWKRREILNHQRLADFIGIKVQDAFYDAAEKGGYFAMASRDATIKNSRVMKQKGLIDWTLNEHTYQRLLKIATGVGLLTVFEDYQSPLKTPQGKVLVKGLPRMIGPGPALEAQHVEFVKMYEEWLNSVSSERRRRA